MFSGAFLSSGEHFIKDTITSKPGCNTFVFCRAQTNKKFVICCDGEDRAAHCWCESYVQVSGETENIVQLRYKTVTPPKQTTQPIPSSQNTNMWVREHVTCMSLVPQCEMCALLLSSDSSPRRPQHVQPVAF